MENQELAVLQELYEREAATERAYRSAQRSCTAPFAELLEPVRQSHIGQMAALARLLGRGEDGSASVACVDGGQGDVWATLRNLEAAEDELVLAYQRAAERIASPYEKRVVEVDLLPTQLRSHERTRRVGSDGLAAPSWERG